MVDERDADLQEFVKRPLDVALQLAGGACGGTYLESCLLISGALSAVSAAVWPGSNIDRARFVETWIRFGVPNFPDASRISVPLLLSALYNDRTSDAEKLRAMRPDTYGVGIELSGRVVVGDEIDADEDEILAAIPDLPRRLVRRFSYPAIFYEHVRSHLVHEYQLAYSATASPFTHKENPHVSYDVTVRHLHLEDGQVFDASTRHIHFHVEWLADLVRALAAGASAAGELPRPTPWWIQKD